MANANLYSLLEGGGRVHRADNEFPQANLCRTILTTKVCDPACQTRAKQIVADSLPRGLDCAESNYAVSAVQKQAIKGE
eukprot:5040625-Pyramimonas_sp.AAC.1